MKVPATITIEVELPDPPAPPAPPGHDDTSLWFPFQPGDSTPRFNAAIAECIATGIRLIRFDRGMHRFDSKPSDITHSIKLAGDGASISSLVRNFNGDFIRFTGSQGFGGGMNDLSIYAAAGTSGGVGLTLYGDANASPDYSSFENIVITGAGTYTYSMRVNGLNRPAPQGVRDVRFRGIDLFCGTFGAALIDNAVGLFIDQLGAFPAGGSSGNVYIQGGSNSVFLRGNIQGDLVISQATRVRFDGITIGLNSDSSGTECYLTGIALGAVVNNLTSSFVHLI